MPRSDQSHTPRRRHIGFANIVAVVALFVALGGGAVAGQATTAKLDKKEKKQVKKISKKQAKKLDTAYAALGRD